MLCVEKDDTLTHVTSHYLGCNQSHFEAIVEMEINPVRVYPNPANDYITIHFADEYNRIVYNLYDIQGKMLIAGEITDQNHKIDITTLNNGVYFIRFTDNKQLNLIRKIIKLK